MRIAALILLLAPMARGDDWFAGQSSNLLDLYHHLHSHPELSFHEVETSKRIADELRQTGAEVTTGLGKYGVVGVLKNGEGPVVLVRSDLDALPIVEQTGCPYASKVTTTDDEGKTVGVMHACGHDVHMTCLVGTARWLADHKDQWKGTVVLIGQPAEEKIGGAKAMLEDGLYTRFPKPNYALALHVAHDLSTGKLAYTKGPAMASSTSIDVLVRGKGGHGARPQDTIDPIVLAAALVLDLQTIVSREISPLDPSVVTVGSIHGGSKHNIIPSEVHLQLTIRSYKPEVRSHLIEAIARKAKGLAIAHRAPEPEVIVSDDTPADDQHAEPGRPGRADPQEGRGRCERCRGRADDGRGGLRPVLDRRRADLHVPPGRGAGRPLRGISGEGRAAADPLVALQARHAAEHRDGGQGDDGGRY